MADTEHDRERADHAAFSDGAKADMPGTSPPLVIRIAQAIERRRERRIENGEQPRSSDDRRWAFMRFMVLVTETGETYLARVRIVQTPWAAVYLHKLDVPDPGLDLHDHPWWFASLILRGGYDEEVADCREAPGLARIADAVGRPDQCRRGVVRTWKAGSIHTMPLTAAHRISHLHRRPTWTLVLTGRRARSWGFYQPDGFVDHRRYDFAVRRAIDMQEGAGV